MYNPNTVVVALIYNECKICKKSRYLKMILFINIGSTRTEILWMVSLSYRLLAENQKISLARNNIVHINGEDGLSEN